MPAATEEGPTYECAINAIELINHLQSKWSLIGKCEGEVKGPMGPVCDMLESFLQIENEAVLALHERVDVLVESLRISFERLGYDFDKYVNDIKPLDLRRKEETLNADLSMYESEIALQCEVLSQRKKTLRKLKNQVGNNGDCEGSGDEAIDDSVLKEAIESYEVEIGLVKEKLAILSKNISTLAEEVISLRTLLNLPSTAHSLLYSSDDEDGSGGDVRLFWHDNVLKFDPSEPSVEIIAFLEKNELSFSRVEKALCESKSILCERVEDERSVIRSFISQVSAVYDVLDAPVEERIILKKVDEYLKNEKERLELEEKLKELEKLAQIRFKESVDTLVGQLKALWIKMRTSEEEQDGFLNSLELYSAKGISVLKEEIAKLELVADEYDSIFKLVSKRKKTVDDMVAFEVTASDPRRLFANSIQLVKEERFRKTAYPSLVKLEKKLTTALAEFDSKHGTPFMVDNEVYINVMNDEISNRSLDAEIFGIAYHNTKGSAENTPVASSPHRAQSKENRSPPSTATRKSPFSAGERRKTKPVQCSPGVNAASDTKASRGTKNTETKPKAKKRLSFIKGNGGSLEVPISSKQQEEDTESPTPLAEVNK